MTDRGPNWIRQRKAAKERDEYTCQHCGRTDGQMQVHHVRPFRTFDHYLPANDLSNLVTLCPPCHGRAEIATRPLYPQAYPIVIPDCRLVRTCRSCEMPFVARAARRTICDDCRTIVCEHCGRPFVAAKITHRKVRYCSTECWHATIKRPPNTCCDCGATIKHASNRCQPCDVVWYRSDPSAPRRGRRHKMPLFTS